MRQRLRCNLLLGHIGRFGLLKDVHIFFYLSLSPSLVLMLQVNQGLRKWAPDQDIAKTLQ